LLLLALWLFLPPLKLESIEVGLSRWLFSNFSFNPHFNFGVLSTEQSKYHLHDARWVVDHCFNKSFLYTVLFVLESHQIFLKGRRLWIASFARRMWEKYLLQGNGVQCGEYIS
jgi:hypothetical protein